jgi:hypothetical protein
MPIRPEMRGYYPSGDSRLLNRKTGFVRGKDSAAFVRDPSERFLVP